MTAYRSRCRITKEIDRGLKQATDLIKRGKKNDAATLLLRLRDQYPDHRLVVEKVASLAQKLGEELKDPHARWIGDKLEQAKLLAGNGKPDSKSKAITLLDEIIAKHPAHSLTKKAIELKGQLLK